MLDARGLSCPEPVVMIRKAMASKEAEYTMVVDNGFGAGKTSCVQHS